MVANRIESAGDGGICHALGIFTWTSDIPGDVRKAWLEMAPLVWVGMCGRGAGSGGGTASAADALVDQSNERNAKSANWDRTTDTRLMKPLWHHLTRGLLNAAKMPFGPHGTRPCKVFRSAAA
jgi:hypothetical protein